MSSLIIDGSNLAMRVWKTCPPLTTANDLPVEVIYAFIRTLKSAMTKYKATEVSIAWDSSKPVARKAIHAEYKQKRHSAEKTPEEQDAFRLYMQQLDALRLIMPSFGVHQYKIAGIEADDIVALLAFREGKHVVLSEDKDFIQLASDDVTVARPIAKITYTGENFDTLEGRCFDTELKNVEVAGWTPNEFLNYRVLVGDSSDEIKGVKGVGPQTAYKIIKKFGTINEALKRPEEVAKIPLAKKILDQRDVIVRNFLLMDLQYAKEFIKFDLEEYQQDGCFDEPELKKILIKYEFFSMINSLNEFCIPFKRLT